MERGTPVIINRGLSRGKVGFVGRVMHIGRKTFYAVYDKITEDDLGSKLIGWFSYWSLSIWIECQEATA